jgi:pimeloyl-ACP methyl ester carboxylesterase
LSQASTASLVKDGFFDSDGIALHYRVWGEGAPILLVHGFSENIDSNWVETGWVDELAAKRRVIALDQRGHGLSGKPHDPAAYAGSTMPDDLVRLMDHLELPSVDVLGYSMGAYMTVRLLTDNEAHLRSAILCGVGEWMAGRRPPGEQADFTRERVTAFLTDEPSTIKDRRTRAQREYAESLGNDLRALAAYWKADRHGESPPDLARVSRPVLIINGSRDPGADVVAEAIPGSKLVWIPDRNHVTVLTDPRSKRAVLDFLGE